MQRILTFCLSFLLFSFFYLYFSPNIYAYSVGKECACMTENVAGSGNNRFYCNYVYEGLDNILQGPGSAYCRGSNLACFNGSKTDLYLNAYHDKESPNIIDSAQGIICAPPRAPTPTPIIVDKTQCLGEGGSGCGDIGQTNYLLCCSGGPKKLLTCQANVCTAASCKEETQDCRTNRDCCSTNNQGVPMTCVGQRADGLGIGACRAIAGSCEPNINGLCNDSKPCCEGAPNYLFCQKGRTLSKCQKQEIVSSSKITCKCDKSGDTNIYRCTRGDASVETKYCPGDNPFCFDKKPTAGLSYVEDRGVYCLNLKNLPPGTAPCLTRDSQGRCLAINSAFGIFNTTPGDFIVKAFGILLAVSGAIAVLLIMRAGYKIMTARGNPEGLQQGREQLIAAIVGLMFLIFSFVFLQVIGVDILQIPGLK
ncbi:hypothetical protein HZA75_02565 [Candidatus Roizmanbacteria bacterium]|nr:hypothetical protein [Candidatus Roizmanbacteria bacterium]